MGFRSGSDRLITLTRDVAATIVPWGTSATLSQGSGVEITQQLGGHFTVVSDGSLYRISGSEADALGLTPEDAGDFEHEDDHEGAPTIDSVEAAAWARLATCYDPEIPVDIVNLGLVYLCQAVPLADGGFRLDVRMTLTAPGCGMGMTIADEAREKLLGIRGVEDVDIDLVWDPPWSREMMSESARLQLGMM